MCVSVLCTATVYCCSVLLRCAAIDLPTDRAKSVSVSRPCHARDHRVSTVAARHTPSLLLLLLLLSRCLISLVQSSSCSTAHDQHATWPPFLLASSHKSVVAPPCVLTQICAGAIRTLAQVRSVTAHMRTEVGGQWLLPACPPAAARVRGVVRVWRVDTQREPQGLQVRSWKAA